MGASAFDERAADWDTQERRDLARELAAVIREQVPLDASMRVIEVGAGTGLLGLELAPDVASIVLSDPSAGMLAATRKKLLASPRRNVSVTTFELGGDPPKGAPFDLAISVLVLHHVADTPAALRSIRDLLTPGGQVALLDLEASDGSFHADDATSGEHADHAMGFEHDGFEHAEIGHLAETCGFAGVSVASTVSIEKRGRAYPLFLLTGHRA